MDEEKLINKLRRRRPEALSDLIGAYSAYAGTIIVNILGPFGTPQDAEELVSDVFLAVWDHADKLLPGKVKAYIGAIARNKAKDALRKRRTELPMDEDVLAISLPSPEAQVLESSLRNAVRQAVEAMEEPEREIFLRYYYYMQTTQVISQKLGIPPGTVKTKLVRGRQALRKIFEGQEAVL